MTAVLPVLTGDAAEQVREVIAEVRPRLRGWLHLAVAPLTLVAGVVLVTLSPNTLTRIGSATFVGSAVVLFTVSAIYHRGSWSPPVQTALRRFDHCNIFLLIAGSYTPYCLLLLSGRPRVALLSVVWVGAGLGVAFRICWINAPRWLHTPIYLVLGWGAVGYFPAFVDGASRLGQGVGTASLVLLGIGGGLYTLGAMVYGWQRPNPWPQSFGFHEVFHAFTILAFTSHYVGISLATYSLR